MKTRNRDRPNTDPRYYGDRKLNKRVKSMHISLLNYLQEHGWRHATRQKEVSMDYQNERYHKLTYMLLVELPDLGFEPTRLERLKHKHFKALVQSWEHKGRKAGTMQNKLSMLRTVCKTLRKFDCIPEDIASLLEDPCSCRVVSVPTEERTPYPCAAVTPESAATPRHAHLGFGRSRS